MEVKINITVDGEIIRGIKTNFEVTEIYFGSSKYLEIKDLREKELIKIIKKMAKFGTITIDVLSCDEINTRSLSAINWKGEKSYRITNDYGVFKGCEEDQLRQNFPDFQPLKKDAFSFPSSFISKKIFELNNFAFGLYLNDRLK